VRPCCARTGWPDGGHARPRAHRGTLRRPTREFCSPGRGPANRGGGGGMKCLGPMRRGSAAQLRIVYTKRRTWMPMVQGGTCHGVGRLRARIAGRQAELTQARNQTLSRSGCATRGSRQAVRQKNDSESESAGLQPGNTGLPNGCATAPPAKFGVNCLKTSWSTGTPGTAPRNTRSAGRYPRP
jgi:hypothetical protein